MLHADHSNPFSCSNNPLVMMKPSCASHSAAWVGLPSWRAPILQSDIKSLSLLSDSYDCIVNSLFIYNRLIFFYELNVTQFHKNPLFLAIFEICQLTNDQSHEPQEWYHWSHRYPRRFPPPRTIVSLRFYRTRQRRTRNLDITNLSLKRFYFFKKKYRPTR